MGLAVTVGWVGGGGAVEELRVLPQGFSYSVGLALDVRINSIIVDTLQAGSLFCSQSKL